MHELPPPVDVTHIWDSYVATDRKDLHTELGRQPRIRSRQYVRRLISTGAPLPPDTFAYEVVTPHSEKPGLARRIRGRVSRIVSEGRYKAFVARQLAQRPTGLLHAHFGTTGWLFSNLAAQRRLPLVVSFYGVDVSQMVRESRWQPRYRLMFRKAACLVVLCEEARGRLMALGCPANKIRIWNHPLDLDAYPYRPRSPARQVRLITAARFVEKKGYPFLLRACAALVGAGRDLRLTAVGYGPLRDEIQNQAAALGLADRFRLIDTSGMSNFDAFYSAILHEHDLFVLPSTTARSGDDEGGPALSLVLAQAAGLPVICTPFPGAARTVVEAQTGWYCRQDDPNSLAERLAFAADHPETWNRMGFAGNRLVRSQFEFARQIDEMIAIYDEALNIGAGEPLGAGA